MNSPSDGPGNLNINTPASRPEESIESFSFITSMKLPSTTLLTMTLPDPDDSSADEEDHCVEECAENQNQNPDADSDAGSISAQPQTCTFPANVVPPSLEDFMRQGSRLQNFMQDALQLVSSREQKQSLSKDDDMAPKRKHARLMEGAHAAELARDKMAECVILQKKLQLVEINTAALKAANTSLREANAASNERVELVTQALRIASQNASAARRDADAAESYAASVATQLEALRTVVDETKRATGTLFQEHEQVSQATRALETNLLQRETDSVRAKNEQKKLIDEQDSLRREVKAARDERRKIESQLEGTLVELNHVKRELRARDAVEQARKDRFATVEKELREAKELMAHAASAAEHTETTTSVLRETIQAIQKENTLLHERMHESQVKHGTDHERLYVSLSKAECEAQSLRIKAASHDEEIEGIRSEKVSCEKHISQLKNRITNLERRLKDATSLIHSPTLEDSSASTSDQQRIFAVPPLTPARDAAVPHTTPKSSICSLCSKAASGMMKSCQCGVRVCDKRAHASCVARVSSTALSGQPLGPPAPMVLCGAAKVS